MLDMGFIHDVRKIVVAVPARAADAAVLGDHAARPSPSSRMTFSTVPFASTSPRQRSRSSASTSACTSSAPRRSGRCSKLLLADQAMDRVLVFTRTKRGADRVCRNLVQAGFAATALHGNKAQNARVRALDAFRNGNVRILVATDIAARGIDVPNISHVVNYELPNEPESYVHRIGRTARAGAGGAAIAFCDHDERPYLQAIERLMRSSVAVGDHRLARSTLLQRAIGPAPRHQGPDCTGQTDLPSRANVPATGALPAFVTPRLRTRTARAPSEN